MPLLTTINQPSDEANAQLNRVVDPREQKLSEFLASICGMLTCGPGMSAGVTALCCWIGASILHQSHPSHDPHHSAAVGALSGALAGEVVGGLLVSAMLLRRAGLFSQPAYNGASSAVGFWSMICSYFVGMYAALKILQNVLNIEETYSELITDGILGGAIVGAGAACLSIPLCCCLCYCCCNLLSSDEEMGLLQAPRPSGP